MNTALDALLAGAGVWRARGGPPMAQDANVVPSGCARLDAQLPDGGWPLGALVEFLLPEPGVGELSLLLPALRALAAAPATQGRHWFAWIAPPLDPYPPALVQGGIPSERLLFIGAAVLQDRLWAVEQALRSGSCAVVLAWIDRVDDRWLRRLKLAAETGSALYVADVRRLRQQPDPCRRDPGAELVGAALLRDSDVHGSLPVRGRRGLLPPDFRHPAASSTLPPLSRTGQ